MELTYKPAQAADIEPLFTFNQELIDAYEDKTQIELHKVLAWVRRKLEQQIQDYTCIYADGRKAGYFHFFAPDNTVMELDDLYIFPAFRGLGIGSAVIRRCCASTDRPVELYVFRANTRALALYQRLGFRIKARTCHISDTRYILRRD